MIRRPAVAAAAVVLLAVVVALPVIAASPSPQPTSSPHAKPSPGPKGKPARPPEVAVTLTGVVAATSGADGGTVYTLASGGNTYTLEVGPRWWRPSADTLKPYVGRSVTIAGEQEPGSTTIEVRSVDGKTIRGEGRPPWAGGWKSVGKVHPGWSQEKADRFRARFGDCFPPGRCKDKGDRSAPDDEKEPEASPEPAGS